MMMAAVEGKGQAIRNGGVKGQGGINDHEISWRHSAWRIEMRQESSLTKKIACTTRRKKTMLKWKSVCEGRPMCKLVAGKLRLQRGVG